MSNLRHDVDINIAVLCDFDDTITLENVAHLILKRFGDGTWEEIRRQYLGGIVPPEEYFERPFKALTTSREDLQNHVKSTARLRDGFLEFVDYCQSRNIEIGVVSLGLDFYIEALLSYHGLDWIPIYCVGTRFTTDGMEFDPKYSDKTCGRWGICKCKVVERYKQAGKQVVYVGDGRNDLCPATRSDLVFARDVLEELCQRDNISYYPLRDFTDATKKLDEFIHSET